MTDNTKDESLESGLLLLRIGWNRLAEKIHQTAVEKGWWEEPDEVKLLRAHIHEAIGNKDVVGRLDEALDRLGDRNDGEMIALYHSEISEALEGMRHGNPPSEKIPEYSNVEEELADLVIRIMDTAEQRGWDVPGALGAKIIYNDGRAYKHADANGKPKLF